MYVFRAFSKWKRITFALHSHTFYVNTHLFKNFIENFIEKTLLFKSKLKDDFIEEVVYFCLMKKIVPGLIGGLILWTIIHLIIDFNEKRKEIKSKNVMTLDKCLKNFSTSEECKKIVSDFRKSADEINK